MGGNENWCYITCVNLKKWHRNMTCFIARGTMLFNQRRKTFSKRYLHKKHKNGGMAHTPCHYSIFLLHSGQHILILVNYIQLWNIDHLKANKKIAKCYESKRRANQFLNITLYIKIKIKTTLQSFYFCQLNSFYPLYSG